MHVPVLAGPSLRIGARVRIGPGYRQDRNRIVIGAGEGIVLNQHSRTQVTVKFDHGMCCIVQAMPGDFGLVYDPAARLEAEREKAEREERERRATVSLLHAIGVPEGDIPPGTLSLSTLLPQILAAMAASTTATSGTAFDAYTPGDSTAIDSLMERVKGLDMSALHTHIKRVKQYLPVVKGHYEALFALEQFLTQYPTDKLVSEDCPSLLQSLKELHSAYTPFHSALSRLDFDTAESLAFLQSVSDLLDSINTTSLIPLPKDHASLSLGDKYKYFQVKSRNAAVEALYMAAGPVITCQPDIEACMAGLKGIDIAIPDVCAMIDTKAKGVLQMLEYLAPRQTESRALLSALKSVPPVTPQDIECAEYSAFMCECKGKNPRLGEGERGALESELIVERQKVHVLKQTQVEHKRLREQLHPYLCFPEVASALGVSSVPVSVPDVSGSQCNGVVGMMVKGPVSGGEEGDAE
ncbi:hypothetical protein KIPB_000175, partial [Kipferlia bialata]|eukprot:g175.t1